MVAKWEISWLQSDDRVRGDRPLRLAGVKQFLPQPASGPSVWNFRNALRKAGVLAFPRGDELTIENHFRDSLVANFCIVAIVYELSHITSLRKKSVRLTKLLAKIRL